MKKSNSLKEVARKLDFIIFGWIINFCFPEYYRPKYNYKPYYKIFFGNIIPQKILRINGNAPWPVHFTSRVSCEKNIKKGMMCDPGDSMGVYIQAVNGIIFGNNVRVGPGCSIISANHNAEFFTDHDESGPIIIGNNVIIYANSVVLPGVNIGDNVIIGAGSVVTKNIPSNSVAVGNPCRVIKKKEAYQNKLRPGDFNKKIPTKYLNYFEI